MPLHSILTTILAEYPKAEIEPFGGNPLANFLRHQAADEVQNALGDLGAGLTVDGSAGAGNWAVVPWISVFDPAITTLEDFFDCHAYQPNRSSIALQIHHRGAAHAV
jgi:hypothetical protein